MSPIWIIVWMPEPDCFFRHRMRCNGNAEFYDVGKTPTYSYWAPVAAAARGFKMALFTASRGNNFVGGTCAPPSALQVLHVVLCQMLWRNQRKLC